MQVYKFGGASIATPENMKALLPIIRNAPGSTVIVVSAVGKTTNALEVVLQAVCDGRAEEALLLAKQLEEQHIHYAEAVLHSTFLLQAKESLAVFFTELQWAVEDATPERFDYSYDQVVSIGELLSSTIFYQFLRQEAFKVKWQDIRDIIRTDETYRDARVDWEYTEVQMVQKLQPLLSEGNMVITQGFIGATSDNATVTLGREGSDYTAAIIAAMLSAESVTIWKDVDGLRNADPKLFPNTVKIEAVSFHEVIEMAYYGAQVIHPKTIKPLQNNHIPLYVRCFMNKDLKGTVIQDEVSNIFYPPLIILKKEQVLVQVTTRDFSFITENNLQYLYGVFHRLKIKVNLMQNAAISLVVCVDHNEAGLQALLQEIEQEYKVLCNEEVSLLTVRHHTPEVLAALTKNRYILLEQKTRRTVQAVIK